MEFRSQTPSVSGSSLLSDKENRSYKVCNKTIDTEPYQYFKKVRVQDKVAL